MTVELRVFADAEELGAALADEVAARAAEPSTPFVLGCPGGRSLRSTYRALAAHRDALHGVVVAMMDEYVVDGGHVAADAHHSCARFAYHEIARPLGIPGENVWLPDPQDPADYERLLAAAGGVDLFLLASGASDGHVAFLAPGSPRDGRTAVVDIAESTRRDNLVTFPQFASVDDVPRRGVSVGLATIADSHAVRLVLHGADKRAAAARLLALERFDPQWPASIVYECRNAAILVDRAALP